MSSSALPAPVDLAGLPFSAATERNGPPILEVLSQWLPVQGSVLEVASGTGQHAAHFAAAHPGWQWQPTEFREAALANIAKRCAGLDNVLMPLPLDVLAHDSAWAARLAQEFDALFCGNLLHIAPASATAGLMETAARWLGAHGVLVIYGPFMVAGEVLAPSNVAFDMDLRERNAQWGLRALHEVEAAAGQAGLLLDQRQAMPANNMLLRFRRSSPRLRVPGRDAVAMAPVGGAPAP